jgi:hypothetical protein
VPLLGLGPNCKCSMLAFFQTPWLALFELRRTAPHSQNWGATMPDLKPGERVWTRGTFVKEQYGAVAVNYAGTIGHLWHNKTDVISEADVSELVEAARTFDEGLSSDCDGPERDALRAALAKFEAAND